MKQSILVLFLLLIIFAVSEQNSDLMRKNKNLKQDPASAPSAHTDVHADLKKKEEEAKHAEEKYLKAKAEAHKEHEEEQKKEEEYRRRIREAQKHEDDANKRLHDKVRELNEALEQIKHLKSDLEKSQMQVIMNKQKARKYEGKAKKYNTAAYETKQDLHKLFKMVTDFTSQYNMKKINGIKTKYNFK